MKILLAPDPAAPNGEDAFCREFSRLARQRGHETKAHPTSFSQGFAADAQALLINGVQPEIFEAARTGGKKIAFRLVDTRLGQEGSGCTARNMALACDRLLVPSQHLAAVAKSWGCNGNVRHVPYAYDRIMAGQIAVLTPHEQRSSAFPIAACASLNAESRPGLETLFLALARLRLDYHLCLIGEGPLLEALQGRARDLQITNRISFLGSLSPAIIGENLRAARAYVDPCGLDDFPNWALQALAAGCPVIAASSGALPEIIRHERNGLCFPTGDAPALAEAIVSLYSLRGLSNRLIAEGIKTVESHDWPATAAAALAVVEELA